MKLTSDSGGQTFYEVPSLANRRNQSLYLIDTKDNYTMGIIKPIDRLSRYTEQDQIQEESLSLYTLFHLFKKG
ncbi:MAG: hypothetical protein IKR28_04400 [Selenomonadaceae bacterium]|nr:hypothetical protein [Selenomonadaceae bacterium]